MNLYPLDPLGVNSASRVDEGWMRYLRQRKPRTVAEILADAAARMDREDYEQDPVVWMRAHRKPSLWRRLRRH